MNAALEWIKAYVPDLECTDQEFMDKMDQILQEIIDSKSQIQPVTYVPAGTRIIIYPMTDLWLRSTKDIEKNVLAMLSAMEWETLCAYLDNKSYQEIASEMERSTKSIDNALQRVKRKLEKFLSTRENELDLATLNKGLLLMAAKEHLLHK